MTRADDWDGLLDPGEHIIWQGQPSGKVRLEFESVFSVIFMAIWSGIPIGMIIFVPSSIFLIVPPFFAAIGVYFFVGQHFWAAFQRRRTFYTLTDKRAFIARGSFGKRTLDSFPITPDTPLQLDEGRARAVWFGSGPKQAMFSNKREHPVGFELLDDPRAIYQLLRNAQRGAA